MGEAARLAFQARWSETVALTAYLDLIRSIAVRRELRAVSDAFPEPAGTPA